MSILQSVRSPPTASLGLVGLLPAAIAARKLWRNPGQTRAIVPAQAQALLSFVLFSLGTSIGLLLR